MTGRQYLLLVLVFIVSFVGFGAYEGHKRGLLLPLFEQQEVALEEIVVTAQPIIIAEVTQKVNSEDAERIRRNEEILATAGHNETVLNAADSARDLRLAQLPARIDYVVQEGDTLWSIAHQLLGDSTQWEQVYEQNKAELGDNPDLIFPGQHITISPATTGVASP